jgi:FkbM family methyltransferase
MLRRQLKRVLAKVGFDLRRHESTQDAFLAQRALVQSDAPLILDVGASGGTVAKRYRSLFPNACIHCFEPIPQSRKVLRHNLEADSLTYVHELAVSDEVGWAHLNINASVDTSSLLETHQFGHLSWGKHRLETKNQIRVPVTKLDAFCLDYSIAKIDILKLDIQGAEYRALLGASRLLQGGAIFLVYLEIILAATYSDQHRLSDYVGLLESHNYELYGLYDPIRRGHRLLQGDFIFIRSTSETAAR